MNLFLMNKKYKQIILQFFIIFKFYVCKAYIERLIKHLSEGNKDFDKVLD